MGSRMSSDERVALEPEVNKLVRAGLSYQQIADELGIKYGQVKWIRGKTRERSDRPAGHRAKVNERMTGRLVEDLYGFVATKPRDKEVVKDQFGISERILHATVEEMQEKGILIECTNEHVRLQKEIVPTDQVTHESNWCGDKIVRIGVCSDKHFNSKFVQITNMHKLYDIYESEGITDVYDCGDLDEGEQMRVGHQYECYNQGSDDHVAEIVRNHPRRKGITTRFITGNHDHSLIKRAGVDIGKQVADQRDDMVYLGQSWATVNLTPNCTLELRHPADGSAYAISYKPQKMVEAMAGGEKPNILAVGHYHKCSYMFYRNVHIYMAGCMQAQTNWFKNKGLSAQMGGWILEAHVDDEGTIQKIVSVFFPFYYATPDDYLSWR